MPTIERSRHFGMFLLIFFAVWTLRATVLYAVDLQFPAGTPRLVYASVVKLSLWVVPAWLYVVYVMRASPWRALRLTTPVNLRTLAYMAGGVAFVFALAWGTGVLRGRDFPAALVAGAPGWVGAIAPIAPSATMEEILFRGFVLQQLRARMGGWQANLVAALLFVLIHWPNWLWRRGLEPGLLADSGGVFVFAVLAGYLVQRTESLWPGVAAHVANNFAASYL